MGLSGRERQLPGGTTAETPSTYARLCSLGTGTGETSYARCCSCLAGILGKLLPFFLL